MPDSNQVLSWAKITRRQLDNWVAKKYIKPASSAGRGFGGVQYAWSQEEAKVVQLMGDLTRAGVRPDVAARMARGEVKACEGLLYALKAYVAELSWQVRVPTEAEPCG
jgi:hypothetical protein